MNDHITSGHFEEMTEKQFHNFINVFNDEFFWFKDESGSIFFSDNLKSVTGFNSEELITLREIIHEDDRSVYSSLSRAENNFTDELELEYRLRTKDDKIKWVKDSIKIFRDDDGKIIRTIGRVTDISKIKFSEIRLNENIKELRKQNEAKENFFSLLSHDLKSPFTSILGFSEILTKEHAISEAERNEYLSYIHSSSEKLLQFINYLIDWSKLKSGKLKLDSEKINIQSLVYSAVSSLTVTAVRKSIGIKIDIENSLEVLGDERLLNTAVLNFINNALKFSYKGSKIFIEACRFNDDFIEIIVKDSGAGISSEDKNKIFKIESMFSTQGTAGEKGTGFGLILSKEIIEKHGGQLWFFSEEGEGSEFHFTLPLSPRIILVVNPVAGNREIISSYLKIYCNDFRIIPAENPHEAIDISTRNIPLLIITSHKMLLMNGIQLIETITKMKNGLELKIIVLSDFLSEEEKIAYEKFGRVVFLESLSSEDNFVKALGGLFQNS